MAILDATVSSRDILHIMERESSSDDVKAEIKRLSKLVTIVNSECYEQDLGSHQFPRTNHMQFTIATSAGSSDKIGFVYSSQSFNIHLGALSEMTVSGLVPADAEGTMLFGNMENSQDE